MAGGEELPERAIAWCLSQLDGARRIRQITRLRGGIAALTHALSVECDAGPLRQVVLRRFAGEVSEHWPPVLREVDTLRSLEAHAGAVRAPKLLAADASGADCDLPALLLERLPGAIDISAQHLSSKLAGLARALSRFHAAAPSCPLGAGQFAIDFARRTKPLPEGGVACDWPRAWALLEELAFENAQLIHGDFHVGNVLFEQGTLCGIVDWSLAECGPWQFDVGYCRVDLSILFGLQAADDFLDAYQAERGFAVAQMPLWDLAGASRAYPDPVAWLPGWLDAGRTDLSPELVREHLADFVQRALAAADERARRT